MTNTINKLLRSPFGMRFVESNQGVEVTPKVEIMYDESTDCAMICEDGQTVPFVQTAASCTRTQTITETTEEPEEASEEHGRQLLQILLTVTETKATPEGPDESDDDSITFGRVW